MQMIKGAVGGLVALVACPCHLPVTLPAILLMTGGTAFGAWLAANQWSIWTASVVLFAGGLALAVFWFGRTRPEEPCEPPSMPTDQALGRFPSSEAHNNPKFELFDHSKEAAHG